MAPSPALARIAPFAVFIAFIALRPLFEDRVDGRWLAATRGIAAGVVLALFWSAYLELRKAPRTKLLDWALGVGVGFAVFGLWITLDAPWMTFATGQGFTPVAPDGSLDATLVALRLIGLVLVVPLMEELFWRSFLMRWIDQRDFLTLDPRRAGLAALAISSVLFATAHTEWLAALVAGALYAGLYKRTGNLWVPTLSHAVTNGTLGIWILSTGSWHYW